MAHPGKTAFRQRGTNHTTRLTTDDTHHTSDPERTFTGTTLLTHWPPGNYIELKTTFSQLHVNITQTAKLILCLAAFIYWHYVTGNRLYIQYPAFNGHTGNTLLDCHNDVP